MKKLHVLLCALGCLSMAAGTVSARTFELSSPDGGIKMTVNEGERVSYNVSLDGKQVIGDSYLSLTTRDKTYGPGAKLKNSKTTSVNEEFTPVVAYKFARIKNHYNGLTLNFSDGFSVEFRAYDDGAAYRFVTNGKSEVEVMDEEFSVNFPAGYKAHIQLSTRDFRTNQEEAYSHMNLTDWTAENSKSSLPSLFETPEGNMILICESGVVDYPQMFVKGTGGNGMTSTFQKYMLEQEPQGDRSMKVTKEADFIARTAGAREYPWRYFVITEDAGGLLETTMTARLAPKSVIKDTSWIKPGLISWEWWNGAVPYGPDVNFEAGLNTETYKYFIDFASNFGIPYIIMDEGWAQRTQDPFTPNPDVDVKELIRYGKEKNVGIVLWLTWTSVENNFGLFEALSGWGVKGLKIDFMDRNDQWMTNYYERVLAEAAKHKLLISFHGSFKPGGLEYKYPNLLTYEGVKGMEQMGGCRPENSVWLPLMRNVAGPMDYTPGAMFSMQPNVYSAQRPNAGSIGTRAYQMALFVLFETGFQMLADNPTLYYRERECTEYITSVPVTWDETRALAVSPGEYVSIAKRKGGKWFVGAMCGSDKPNWRDVEVTLDFLDEGREYTMTWFEDGINAPRQAMDYRKKTAKVKKGDKVTMHIARNGGWAGVIE